VVLAQDRYGPQFFVPARFLPQKYNYYRPVPMSSRGDNSNVNNSNSNSSSSVAMDNDIESGTGPECAICYNTVDPSLQDHMITPCDHRYVADDNISLSLSVQDSIGAFTVQLYARYSVCQHIRMQLLPRLCMLSIQQYCTTLTANQQVQSVASLQRIAELHCIIELMLYISVCFLSPVL
jgi:hypothetical protein